MAQRLNARKITLTVEVIVPVLTTENEVSDALNAAFDEPPCEWGDWEVGGLSVIKVERVHHTFEEQESDIEMERRTR